MAKDKSKAGMKNKHLHARISFLHNAATYLTKQHESLPKSAQDIRNNNPSNPYNDEPRLAQTQPEITPTYAANTSGNQTISTQKPSSGGLPLHLSSHLNQVARKSQIRLAQKVKHSICKRCGAIQVEGETCNKFTENLSKRSKKPHADVLVQECGVCGARKRWPIGAKRQKKNGQRKAVTVD